MARKRTPDTPAAEPELRESADSAMRKINERIAKGTEIRARSIQNTEQLEAAQNDYRTWNSYNNELLLRLFSTAKFAEEYSWWGIGSFSMGEPSGQEKLEALGRDIAEKIRRLESIRNRLELIPLASGVVPTAAASERAHTNKAFVVHGHDDAARESLARFLEKLGIDAVILHEQATEGRTIVEKLEFYANVDFAIVLLTPDDVGGSQGTAPDDLQPRARQNVVLELGYFVGKLGRKNVCALHKGPLELPSDYLGVVYVALDDGGGWRLQLAKELRSAGFAIDMNLAL